MKPVSSDSLEAKSAESTFMTVVRLLRWDKPAGRLILMVPALWAVVLATLSNHLAGETARRFPEWPLLGVIVLGTLATSAGGCVVNDLWDRDIDTQVERTRNRPLASRALSVKVGIGVAMVAFFCAWGLSFYLKPLSFWLWCGSGAGDCALSAGKAGVSSAAARAFDCVGVCGAH